MEADTNAANKIIFGTRMLQNVRKYELMPGEIYSERGRTAVGRKDVPNPDVRDTHTGLDAAYQLFYY